MAVAGADPASGAAGGAATGATFGSLAGPIGIGIGAAVGAVGGGVLGFLGQSAANSAAEEASEQAIEVAATQVRQINLRTGAQISQRRRRMSLDLGRQRVSAAARGIGLDSDANLARERQLLVDYETDRRTLITSGANARQSVAAGAQAQITSFFNGTQSPLIPAITGAIGGAATALNLVNSINGAAAAAGYTDTGDPPPTFVPNDSGNGGGTGLRISFPTFGSNSGGDSQSSGTGDFNLNQNGDLA